MKILAIGAHADDVELGCGGSLLRWSREADHQVSIYVATDSAYTAADGTVVRSAEDAHSEAVTAAKKTNANLTIGPFRCFELAFTEPLNTALVEVIERVDPDLVLTHWDGDFHSDHKALAQATLHACRRTPNVLMYRSNIYASTACFDARYYVDISATLDDKLDLIETFRSENGRTGGTWLESERNQAALYGRESGHAYAEAFQVVRLNH